jgi:hypothetical protein
MLGIVCQSHKTHIPCNSLCHQQDEGCTASCEPGAIWQVLGKSPAVHAVYQLGLTGRCSDAG